MRIRPCTPDDLDAINEMRAAWYGPENRLTPEFFRWAFFDRYPEPAVFLAMEDEGRVVGTQALLPIPGRRGDAAFRTCKSEETLLDPAYRGRGLFQKLYDACLATLGERNDVIWGETSAVRAFRGCGFATPATTHNTYVFTGRPTAEFPLGRSGEEATTARQRVKRTTFRYLHSMLRLKTVARLRTQTRESHVRVGADLSFYADVWRGMARRYPHMVSIDRTEEWLDYRFARHPHFRYRYLSYENGADRGVIPFVVNEKRSLVSLVDFVACGDVERVARSMTASLVRLAAEEGWSLVTDHGLHVDLAPTLILRRALRRFGALSMNNKNTWLVIRFGPNVGEADPRRDAHAWYYTTVMTFGLFA